MTPCPFETAAGPLRRRIVACTCPPHDPHRTAELDAHDAEMAAARDEDRVARVAEGGGL